MEIIDGIKWDVGPNDPIEYFDPEKSYYITKYRPINKTQGLDFNPDWFREDAISKLTTNSYSKTIYGSKAYKEFWDERFNRCNNGFEVNGYRLTGDNYFFLNFYKLKSSDLDTINQTYSFPQFLVFQYEYFHYIEICEKLKKDVAVLKSRGIGWSEIASSFSVRPYTTIPNYRIVISAYSKNHLEPTLGKLWYQLNSLNESTEGAFKRIRMVTDTKDKKRASKKKKDGSEEGHMSEIEGIICDDPDKLRGDRIQKLIYEEAGADPVLQKKWVKGEALITVLGGKRVGMRIAFGTGGSSKANSMEGLKKLIRNPKANNILPVRHNHTMNGEYVETGLFIPAYRMVYHLMDKRGWCDPIKAKEWYNEIRASKASDPKDLLDYKAEYCFTIEEALIQVSDNMFPKEELAEQLAAIQIYKTVPKPDQGSLVWEVDKNTQNRTGKVKWRKNSIDDTYGKIKIIEHPITTDNGEEYNNLYVGGIDAIDIGTADSTGTDKNPSEFCIVIKKRVFGMSQPMYVAIYKDRPRDPREAYENAAKLLTYYNCKAVLESTRTAIITHFRNTRMSNLLMKRPRSTMSDTIKGNSNMIGAPASLKTINHYRELLYDFCLDYSGTIVFEEFIEQLLNYSDENKKDFDIVAAAGMAELGDEELSSKQPKIKEPKLKDFQDVGWWTDARGYKHYGIIPRSKEERINHARIRTEDSWLYKDELSGRL